MKTRNFAIFMLTAVLCGALFCTDSQARVCFATDKNCGSGGNFPATPLVDPNDTACENEGYVSGATCLDGYFKYNCPYKSSYVKCCAPKFRYEGCIYPLEVDTTAVGGVIKGQTIFGKCGTRYACKCPDEYGVTSDYAKQNNCQPGGGYCMLNDGTTDTIKYKTCTCDRAIYTDKGNKCKNNQTLSASCTDDAGETYSKCYCDRAVYEHASCEYGPAIGASTCIDSNSQREYYSRCKTAEEACRTYDEEEDGDSLGTTVANKKHTGFQHTDCSLQHNCRTKNQVYNPDTKKYEYLTSYNCILGEQCPYPTNPALYKCVFDKASWCVGHGYTSTMSTKPREGASCSTVDGFVGTYEVCPGNDDNALYYYTCKLPCEQEVRRAFSKGYLTQDTSMVGDKGGVVGFVRTDSSGNKHLYITEDITLPKSSMNIDWGSWEHIGNKVSYSSINGMWALGNTNMKYSDGSLMFAGCRDSSDKGYIWDRPVMKFNGNNINKDNTFLNRDLSDISIELYATNTKDKQGGFGENFIIDADHEWHNVGIISVLYPEKVRVGDEGYHKFLHGDWVDEIIVNARKNLTLSGRIGFLTNSLFVEGYNDPITGKKAYSAPFNFRIGGTVIFRNATINTNGEYNGDIYRGQNVNWDGDDGTVLFIDSKMANTNSSVGDFWSSINVGLSGSEITATTIRTHGSGARDAGYFRFGGNNDVSTVKHSGEKLWRARGVHVINSSTLTINEPSWLNEGVKMYIELSNVIAAPIKMENSTKTLICMWGGKAEIGGKSFSFDSGRGAIRHRDNGGLLRLGSNYHKMEDDWAINGIWYYKFDKGNYTYNPCSTGGKCKGDCNSDFDPNWNGSTLCTGCYNANVMGLAY